MNLKNLFFYLSILFFVLTLLDKSLVSKDNPDTGKTIVYRNIPAEKHKIPEINTDSSDNDTNSNWDDLADIPTYDPEPIPEATQALEQVKPKSQIFLYIYYLKFFGRGSNSYSRLVQTRKKAPETVEEKILVVLRGLIKGPKQEDKTKGLLTTIPADLKISTKFHVSPRGILYLSASPSFARGAGADLMQDRLDQLTYSLLSIQEIKGIDLRIKHQKITSIGSHNIAVPVVLTRSPRKILYSANL
ncbi:MAG: GerMN domain-containing protein [Spirochaetota bacterium]